MSVYEVVGAVDASAADAIAPDGDAILVEQEDSEYLIARPKGGDE